VKTDSDGFLKGSARGVHDEFLIRREYYNPNDFDVVMTRDKTRVAYIDRSRIPRGPEYHLLKAREWVILPHGYWLFTPTNGAEIVNLVQIFGDDIGKGIKSQSLPEVRYRDAA